MIESIELAKYVERNYEEKVVSQGWVEYGDDNLFPQYLIDLYNSSAVHHALVESIAYMIFGEGIKAEGQGQLQIEEWGLQDEIRKACIDLKLQGGYCLEVKWSLDRSYIKEVTHIPFEKIRAGVMQVDGSVPYYYHCLDWENHRKVGVTPICAFGPDKKNEHPVQLMYVKPFAVGSMYYPKPDYMGSINWIEVDKQIAVYHNNNLQNGMSPSFAIHWKNGIPPKEERREIRMDMEAQLTGSHNAGKFMMTFSDGGDTAPTIEPFELSQASEQYQFLSEESTNKIMIGHRVTSPALFGVKTAGQLGGTDELKVSSELMQRNVIKPYQMIINQSINTLLRESGNMSIAKIQNEPLFLSEKKKDAPTDADRELWLQYLDLVGEVVDDEWEEISDEPVTDAEQEGLIHANEVKFFKRFADPEEKSQVDSGLYKIRYRYNGKADEKSRDFCTRMVANAKQKVVYRYEDIIEMGDAGINGDFAPQGKSNYSIWLYKGGVYCRHFWSRVVYFRKREGGRFLPNEGLDNDKRVSVASADRAGVPNKSPEWDTASTRTNDLPNRGSLKNR